MTVVVITQPMLFPWLGFFEQLCMADVYIYLDDAQFSKGSFTNRVQIDQGLATKWLTIPVSSSSSSLIKDLRSPSTDFKRHHLAFVTQLFRKAPFKEDALHILRHAYEQESISDILIASTETTASYLDLHSRKLVTRSSDLAVHSSSWQRVLDLVKAVGGTKYLTGHGAKTYLDHTAFERAGVEVKYMDYSKTTWPRGQGMSTPYISVLDAIAWTGKTTKETLRPRCRPWRDFLEQAINESRS